MEFLKEKKLFCRAKSIVSSLYGIILWSTTTSTSSYYMQITKHYWPLSPGLKTLIYLQEDQSLTHRHLPFIIHSYMISSSSKSLPPSRSQSPSSNTCSSMDSSSFSSMLDDLIGTDSGVCLGSNEEEIASRMRDLKPDCDRSLCKRDQDQCEIRKKLYPPTIPLLARTGNLPGHMPWILTRQYSDGRLILREERLKHHEYFEARRENGRLILNLVALDHTVPALDHQEEEEEDEEEDLELIQEEERENTEQEEDGDDEFEDMKEKSMAASWASSVPKSCWQCEMERAGDLPKCFTYAGRMMMWESYVSCT